MAETHWELKLYRGKAGLERLAENWRTLTVAAARTEAFQLVEWRRCFLAELEDDPEAVFFCVLHCAGEPVAIFPLKRQIHRRFGLKKRVLRLAYLGTELGDIVCRETPDARQYLARLLEALQDRPELQWDEIVLPSVMETGHAFLVLEDAGVARCVRLPAGGCNCLTPLPEAERYERYSKNTRKYLRKATRALAKLGDASFETVTTWPELEGAYEEFLELEASGWKGRSERGAALKGYARWTAFYRELLRAFAADGRAEIIFLRLGGRAIGGIISFRGAGTAYVVKTAYDEEHARVAPGNLTLEHLLERYAHDDSVNSVNLVVDVEWHKKFKPTPVPVYRYHLYNSTPAGLLSCAAQWLKQKLGGASSRGERDGAGAEPAAE